MSLTNQQIKEALQGYDNWRKQQSQVQRAGDILGVDAYLEWYESERNREAVEMIRGFAESDIWDDELGKQVRELLGVEQGKPRLVEEEE